MSLQVTHVALEAVTALRPLMACVRRHNRALALQLEKAASSVVLNAAEADYSDPGTKKARCHSAAGSANESRWAVRVAIAWGYITEAESQEALERFDRVLAMLWKLTH